MKYINKPVERDPNTSLRSKTVVKMSNQEMREALASVMAFRDRRAVETLAAPYTPHRRRFVDSSSSLIDLWKHSKETDKKSADKDGSVVSLW